MDSKNVLIAVILSTIVLISWSTFFEPPVIERQNNENEISKIQQELKLKMKILKVLYRLRVQL